MICLSIIAPDLRGEKYLVARLDETKTHCFTYSFAKSFLCLVKSSSAKHFITKLNCKKNNSKTFYMYSLI